jgi:hypothetical protein
MYVLVNSTQAGGGGGVVEPDDNRRLHVETDLTDRAALSEALRAANAGWADADAAWLGVEFLNRTAEPASRPSWEAEFTAMVSYAGSKGWLSPDGRHVRAHVVVTGEGD